MLRDVASRTTILCAKPCVRAPNHPFGVKTGVVIAAGAILQLHLLTFTLYLLVRRREEPAHRQTREATA